MIKIINLDEFAVRQKIQIKGKEYTVKGVTLEDVIEGRDYIGTDVHELREYLGMITDIPKDVIVKLDFKQLSAIRALSRGLDIQIVKDGTADEAQKKTES